MSHAQEFKLWLSRIPNTEPIMKTDRFERGSYMVFDTATWDCMRKVRHIPVPPATSNMLPFGASLLPTHNAVSDRSPVRPIREDVYHTSGALRHIFMLKRPIGLALPEVS